MGEIATVRQTPRGERAAQKVLEAALLQAGQVGLTGLTFGTLAQQVGLSKSGLFAHVRSMEDLQLQTLRLAVQRWIEGVLRPALRERTGRARLEQLFERWIRSIHSDLEPAGNVLVSAVFEFDDAPPSPVRDEVVRGHRDMQALVVRLARRADAEGALVWADEPEQFAFEFLAIVHAHHQQWKLLRADPEARLARTAFRRLLRSPA